MFLSLKKKKKLIDKFNIDKSTVNTDEERTVKIFQKNYYDWKLAVLVSLNQRNFKFGTWKRINLGKSKTGNILVWGECGVTKNYYQTTKDITEYDWPKCSAAQSV